MKFTNLNFLKNNKPKFKLLLTFGLILFIVLMGFSYYANFKVKKLISEIVGLKCDKIEISLLSREANFKDIVYNSNKSDSASSQLICKNISLNGIKWWSLIIDKRLKINELHIFDIQGVILQSIAKQDTIATNEEKSPHLKSISINTIYLDKINIDFTKSKQFHTKIEDLHLELNRVEYDLSQPLKSIQYQGFEGSLKNASWTPEQGNYAFHCSDLVGSTKDNSISFKGIKLQPLHSKKNWIKHFKFHKSRLELETSRIIGTGLKYKKLLNGEGLIMNNLAVENLNLEVYIDKKLPPCTDCYKPFFHEKLLAVNLPITIEKVELKNNNIDIEVINEKDEKVAEVDFQKIYASIYNITNEPNQIKNNPKTIADVKAMFLGKEKLNVQFNFNLSDQLNAYQVEGKMETMEMTAMNNIFKFGSKAKVKSGELNQLNFKVDGNQEVATGEMAFNYENFEIEILNKNKSKSKKLLSKLVNKIGIKKNNSTSEGNFKKGKIYYPRTKNKGFFHQLWRAIQSGFKSTIMPNILLPDELEVD